MKKILKKDKKQGINKIIKRKKKIAIRKEVDSLNTNHRSDNFNVYPIRMPKGKEKEKEKKERKRKEKGKEVKKKKKSQRVIHFNPYLYITHEINS